MRLEKLEILVKKTEMGDARVGNIGVVGNLVQKIETVAHKQES